MIDVVVVGGGPAGLATAMYAARAGMEVVVLEPRAAPIDKACGEGLMPGAVAALAELGVDPPGVPLTGIRYLDSRRSVAAEFRTGCGLGVRRTALHAAMRDAADRAGVTVQNRAAAVGGIRQDVDSVTIGDVTARWLVGADGLHSPTRRALGLEARPRGLWPVRFGQRAHVACAPWTDHVEVYWSRHAEAYVTPVSDDLVGVAILSSLPAHRRSQGPRRAPYAEQLQAFPRLSERLGGRVPDATSVRGAGPLRQVARDRVAGRVLLVGDAAGYVDALTGEGIAIAVGCARELVRSLVEGRPDAYEHRWRAVTRRYRWLTDGLVAARGPLHLGRAIVPAAARLPRLFAATVDVLAGG